MGFISEPNIKNCSTKCEAQNVSENPRYVICLRYDSEQDASLLVKFVLPLCFLFNNNGPNTAVAEGLEHRSPGPEGF